MVNLDADTAWTAALVLLVFIMAYLGYLQFFSWTSFSYKSRDAVKFTGSTKRTWASLLTAADPDGDPNDEKRRYGASALRFKNAQFTVVDGEGVRKTQDVTSILNRMAMNHNDNDWPPRWLKLDQPLNPFSFRIPGYNEAVKDPTARKWLNPQSVTLTGRYRLIY